MTDPAPTFSVEVLGFPPGADPEELAKSVSECFGISVEEGRRMVVKAPLRVKKNAAPDVTQKLVRQLRKLGADVLVRNERTGEERTYRVGDTSKGTISSGEIPMARREVVTPVVANPNAPPPDDTLPSEEDEAPAEAAPVIHVMSAAREPISTPLPPMSLPTITEKAENAADSNRRISRPSDPSEGPRSGKPASRQLISAPPPSGPASGPGAPVSVPPASAAKLDFCASCSRPVDKGETCAKCGWNNATKERVCRQCKGKLSIVSAVSQRPWLVGLVLVASMGLAAVGFLLFGPLFAAAFLALGAAGALVGDALSLRQICKQCKVALYSARLQKEESQRFTTARSKSIFAALLCAGITAGFAALTSYSGPVLSGSSYGVAWRLPIPRAHNERGDLVSMIKTPAGMKRVRVEYAARPYLGGVTYHLSHVQYTEPSGSTEADRDAVEAALKQIVEVVYSGSVAGAIEAAGEGREVSFTGTFRDKKVFGRLRGIQVEHDLLFVGVTSGDEEDVSAPAARQFLGSLVVERDGAK